MPTYVYEHATQNGCPTFDYIQRMSEERLTVCPKCGKEVRRAVTMFRTAVSSKRAFKRLNRHKDGEPFKYNLGGQTHQLGTDRKDAAKRLQDIANAHYPRGMATVETE